MITLRMAALASALMLCLSGSALAQQSVAENSCTVRSLYKDCKGLNDRFCEGYLSGVARALDNQRSFDLKWKDEYCPPTSAIFSSHREVFMSWAEHSEFWALNCYDGVLVAFWVAYFCPND